MPPSNHTKASFLESAAIPKVPAASDGRLASHLPTKPLLTRSQLLELLNKYGFPISKKHLDALCLPSRRSGPPVVARWGLRPMYDEDLSLEWAMSRSALHPADHAA